MADREGRPFSLATTVPGTTEPLRDHGPSTKTLKLHNASTLKATAENAEIRLRTRMTNFPVLVFQRFRISAFPNGPASRLPLRALRFSLQVSSLSLGL